MANDKETYQRLRREHKCTSCWQQDERTLAGRKLCARCYEKSRESARVWARGTYAWRVKNHYCGRCGEKDAYTMNGRSMCAECAEKEAARKRKKTGHKPREINVGAKKSAGRISARERPYYGLCFFCGEPIGDRLRTNFTEARTCEKCYQRCARIGSANLGRQYDGISGG